MNCPKCGSQNIRVTDSIPDDDKYVFRRRRCKECGELFRTAEFVLAGEDPLKYVFSEVDQKSHARRQIGGKR